MKRTILAVLLGVLVVTGRRDVGELEEFERMMSEPKDRTSWVDPLDMGMYNTKTESCSEVVSRLTRCEKDLVTARTVSSPNTTTVRPPTTQVHARAGSEVFLKRHVQHLIARLGLSPTTPAHLKLEIFLTPFQVQTLHNFVSPKTTVHAVDVDQILSTFIKNYETHETHPWLEHIKVEMTSLKDPLLVLLMSLSLTYLIVTVVRRLPALHMMLLILVVSVTWHWVHLYKATWASKHSKLMQSNAIPAECRPQDMTWFQTIQSSASSLVTSVDKCEEYHKAIMVDPIYEVNPATALVDLVTKLLLHPLSSLGKEVGSMFTGLLGEVPLLWKVPVLILFVILLMFVMILMAGYEVRLPLFLGKIGPATNHKNENVALQQQITELKSIITNVKSGSMGVDGTDENCLGFSQDRKSSVARQVSGVEELLPLGYDCQQKAHPGPVDPGTPRRAKLQRNRILTPVKSRVMSQPDLFKNSGDSEVENTEHLVLDLTRKRSDSFPNKSPVKNLVVKDGDSPSSTRFSWISTEQGEENKENEARTAISKEIIFDEDESKSSSESLEEDEKGSEPTSDFLNKVEDLFKSSEEVCKT
jgi:hypothetical protein